MPTLALEWAARAESGRLLIAGLDEAGRGALAGPVVAGAVILDLDSPDQVEALQSVDDSKRLSAASREHNLSLILQHAVAVGIGCVPASQIDQIGIIAATKEAMRLALLELEPSADYLLVDGRLRLATVPLPQQSIIRGDSKSLSIAAASIVAKVHRDKIMVELDPTFPAYGFARHKGYGTEFHRQVLAELGGTPVHRYSFSPLRARLL